MSLRITDSSTGAESATRLAKMRTRIAAAQERIATGKRLNRPSDNPASAAAIVRVRTQQSDVEGFRSNAATASESLQTADAALESYENLLDRARALLTQAASDTAPAAARRAAAVELEGIRAQTLNLANATYGSNGYVFGGVRNTVAPFDSNTAALNPASATTQTLRLEPEAAPVTVGVTARNVFTKNDNSIFTTLDAAVVALRGSGDAELDHTTLRGSLATLDDYSTQARTQHATIGAQMQNVDSIAARLDSNRLALASTADRLESADFAESALEFSAAQRAYEALLQTTAQSNRRSLIDFLS